MLCLKSIKVDNVHSCLGALVLGTACLLSAGYALTCRNMYLVVEKEIRLALVSTM